MWDSELQQYMRVSGYSSRTISSYLEALKRISSYYRKSPSEIAENELEKYLSKLSSSNRSPYTLNQYHMALKLFKSKVLNLPWQPRFGYTKRHKKLPIVLSRGEIAKLIGVTKNTKHRLMLSLAYGSGLRVCEVVSLRVRDIDLSQLCLTVAGGKGNNDRITIIPPKLTQEIGQLVRDKSRSDYLFESERGGKMSTRSAQLVMTTSLKLAQVKKAATFHSLRHSFATHLLENGVDIRHIQKLLGHSSITTTQQYTKVTNPHLMNIRSPL